MNTQPERLRQVLSDHPDIADVASRFWDEGRSPKDLLILHERIGDLAQDQRIAISRDDERLSIIFVFRLGGTLTIQSNYEIRDLDENYCQTTVRLKLLDVAPKFWETPQHQETLHQFDDLRWRIYDLD